MSSLSEEEENYVRMSLLLTGLSPRAVRAIFDKEFPPTSLQSTLNQKYNKLLSLQKSKVINQAQWVRLFPPRSGVVDPKSFDVTLMICLIRNLTSVSPPTAGFDCLPSTVETTPGADLARIKYYRNYLAHLDDNKIDNSVFTKSWNDISDAIGRLGGSSLYQESQALKNKILDQSNREIMLEVQNLKLSIGCLKDDVTTKNTQTTEEIKELKTGHQQLTQEIQTSKDTVPWNIKDKITTELQNWKDKDRMFIVTRAANYVLQCTKTNSCVIVTGSSGVGKTFTVRHVALQMAVYEYDILPVTDPDDIVKFNNPNKKTLYVIDDLCGTYTLNQTYLDKWKTTHEQIKRLLQNNGAKIIASCRLQVYQDEQFKLLPLFTACECNLLRDMSLSKEEKQLIADTYLKSEVSKISQYIDLFDFFPLLCTLYNENQTLDVIDFFKNPFTVYEEEVNKLKTEKAHGKYCALALCVMFNNNLKEEWLTDDVNHDIKQVIKNTCEACRLNRGTSRLVLKDELDSLIQTFLKKEKGCYRTIHDKLFDFLSFYFGKTPMIQCIIKHGNDRLISERLVFKNITDSDQFATIVPDKYQKVYIERMCDDWSKGEIFSVFTNINMKSPEFRNIFLGYLKNLDITYQKQLATKCDNAAFTTHVPLPSLKKRDYNILIMTYYGRMYTPLQHCCALGDINIVKWCCRYGADVNYCIGGESPLYIACKGGYTDIVTKLLENKAEINMCTEDGVSPLYIACEMGYSDIVTKLVENKADINIFRCDLLSIVDTPLSIACKGGYTDIVTTLVDNKADINRCTEWGESPLYIACKGGHTAIVTKFLDNKVDIITWNGGSPLYVACERGYSDIVNMLVDNKADINECTDRDKSPLYIACKGGYTDIVTKLVDNKADINKCTRWGQSPLYIACQGGYTDIVTNLMYNKAEINNWTLNGESHLYVACKGGYTDIVTKLMDNNADFNKCTYDGESPLYIACKGGYTVIVDMLVDNKADINKFTWKGESPLYTACEGGYANIVARLVFNKADINKCTLWRQSPVYIACKGGYTDIVTMLVDNHADINKCTQEEVSPLYIACHGGYTDIVTKLVDNNADFNKCTLFGNSPLFISCKGGYADIVTKLLDNKADINMCEIFSESPLYIACKGGYTGIVTKLVDNKADINKCRRCGESPLYISCKGGYADIVTKLVDNKADINKCTWWGESPLYTACQGGYTGIVTKLVDNKADINTCTEKGKSPLYIACQGGYTDIVTKLVDNKAEINMCTEKGKSPLYIACKGGYTDIVTKLVDNKADINMCTEKGKSPLYIACKGGYTNIVATLVDKNADIKKLTDDGESPLYIARYNGHTDIVTKLVENKEDIQM